MKYYIINKKNILIVLGCLFFNFVMARESLDSVIYPISKDAVLLINNVYEHQNMESESPDFSYILFFGKYGIDLQSDEEGIIAYDGESVMITTTPQNHNKLKIILSVVEDMAIACKRVNSSDRQDLEYPAYSDIFDSKSIPSEGSESPGKS